MVTDDPVGPANPETRIPSLSAAIWKLEYVLVEGSKKSRAAVLPL